MKYRKFIEVNDWEGETWNFFIPIMGNETALIALKNIIKDSDCYSFSQSDYGESEVDFLIDEGGKTTYMDEYQKLSGRLDVTKIILNDEEDTLYKGGIKDAMEEK